MHKQQSSKESKKGTKFRTTTHMITNDYTNVSTGYMGSLTFQNGFQTYEAIFTSVNPVLSEQWNKCDNTIALRAEFN